MLRLSAFFPTQEKIKDEDLHTFQEGNRRVVCSQLTHLGTRLWKVVESGVLSLLPFCYYLVMEMLVYLEFAGQNETPPLWKVVRHCLLGLPLCFLGAFPFCGLLHGTSNRAATQCVAFGDDVIQFLSGKCRFVLFLVEMCCPWSHPSGVLLGCVPTW